MSYTRFWEAGLDLGRAPMQTAAMGVTRHGNYFATALWAGLAAPSAVYAAPAQDYVLQSAGCVERSFGTAGYYLTAALAQHRAEQPAVESAGK
jgi:hypothetical protein